MKNVSVRLIVLMMVLFAFGLISPYGYSTPSLIMENVVVPPGIKGNAIIPEYTLNVFANNEIRNLESNCIYIQLEPVTEDAPPILTRKYECGDFAASFDGPGLLFELTGFDIPSDIPEGSIYRIAFLSYPESFTDDNGSTIKITAVDGSLLARRKPFLRGDIDDNAIVDIRDVVFSLRLLVGLESDLSVFTETNAYMRAAGDMNRDGSISVSDTLLLLKSIL